MDLETESINNREVEEKLREAASIGDLDMIKKIVEKMYVNVNSQNSMNGRTALHWGAKRGHVAVVHYLLVNGADPSITDHEGKLPAELSTSTDIHLLLGGTGDIKADQSRLPIVPSYLAHPPFPYSSASETQPGSNTFLGRERLCQETSRMNNHINSPPDDELVLKARLANCDDQDFIEVELPRTNLKYEALLNLLCAELCIDKQLISRIRKLPDTILRKDKDIARLQDFQEVELVLTNKAISAASRGYGGVGAKPGMTNEQILY